MTSAFVLPLRAAQGLLAVIILGLVAYGKFIPSPEYMNLPNFFFLSLSLVSHAATPREPHGDVTDADHVDSSCRWHKGLLLNNQLFPLRSHLDHIGACLPHPQPNPLSRCRPQVRHSRR